MVNYLTNLTATGTR